LDRQKRGNQEMGSGEEGKSDPADNQAFGVEKYDLVRELLDWEVEKREDINGV